MVSNITALFQQMSGPSIRLMPDEEVEIIAHPDDPEGVPLWRVVNGTMGRRLHYCGTFADLEAAKAHSAWTGLAGEWIADMGDGQRDEWFVPYPAGLPETKLRVA